MSDVTPIRASEQVRSEISRAFTTLRPSMLENAERDAELDPDSRLDDFSAEDLEQFVNAYETLVLEALEGEGRSKRDLILETALPPLVASGSTALSLVRSNVISAVMLAHRLLPLVDEEIRDDAARWLASFLSGYSCELTQRALALEAETG
jgi:hypothetical protein